MRLNMSRPMKSAPSQYTPPGRASEALASVEVGSNGAMKLAKTAVITKGSTITAPIAPSGWRRAVKISWLRRPVMLAPARWSSASWSMMAIVLIRVLDARVEDHVGHVDQEIDRDHHEGDQHHQVLHDRVVAPADRLDEEAGDARDVEHRLGDDQATHQEGRLDADDGDHGQQRIAQRMVVVHRGVRSALGARC